MVGTIAGKTISFPKGKGNIRHNNRDFVADNVDRVRMEWNRTYVKEDIAKAYEKCFGDSLRAYNAKQKRKDRQKGDYISEIKNSGNREKVFYENVMQIGTMEDTGVTDKNGNITDAQMAEKLVGQYEMKILELEEANGKLRKYSDRCRDFVDTEGLGIKFDAFLHPKSIMCKLREKREDIKAIEALKKEQIMDVYMDKPKKIQNQMEL